MVIDQRAVFVFLGTFLVVLITFGHQSIYTQSIAEVEKVRSDKPSIYITFDRRGPRQGLRDDEKGVGVFLRLHNNLTRPIRFCAFGISNGQRMAFYNETGEIGINYEVDRDRSYDFLGRSSLSKPRKELVESLPVGYPNSGLCHSYELAGDRSLSFSVPAEHLVDRLFIRIPFNYHWEAVTEKNPIHFVVFSAAELPKK